MGNILIMYDTDSDRRFTETMVPLVEEGVRSLEGMDVRVRFVDDCTTDDVFWADGIAIGCPTHFANISWRMKQWWDERVGDIWFKTDGKFAVAFTSAGGLNGGGELVCQCLNAMMMNFGYLVFGITDYVGKKQTLHYGAIAPGEPRQDHEKEACRRAGRRLAEWVGTFVDRRNDCHPLKAEYNRFWDLG